MTGHAPSPDDFTLTVHLSGPEMRRALRAIATAFEDAEAACGPAVNPGVRSSNKPGSRPPAGNAAAVRACRSIVRQAAGMAGMVERLYREMDPDERAAAAEFRAMVRSKRAETAQVSVADGRLVVKGYRRLADAIGDGDA